MQRFQEGGAVQSPSALDEFLARQGQASIDPMARTKELSPAYRELLGLGAGADRSGMAFDIAQAALGYAANIGPDGQPLRGSGAARLAGATRALPGQIGARAEAARQDETRARMAALQQAQSEQAAVQASNLALSQAQSDLLIEEAKRDRFRPATAEEKTARGFMPEDAVQINDADGRAYKSAGSPVTNINMPGDTVLDKLVAEDQFNKYEGVAGALRSLPKIDQTLELLERGNLNVGFATDLRQNIDRFRALILNDPAARDRVTDTELLNSLLGSEVFPLISALGIGARGLDTPAERNFLLEVMTGGRTLDQQTLTGMTALRKNITIDAIQAYNDALASGEFNGINLARQRQNMPLLESVPVPEKIDLTDLIPGIRDSRAVPTFTAAQLEAERSARAAGSQ